MRFCPFCTQEIEDDTDHCDYCGKRLASKGRPTAAASPAPAAPAPAAAPPPPTARAAPPPPMTVAAAAPAAGRPIRRESTAVGYPSQSSPLPGTEAPQPPASEARPPARFQKTLFGVGPAGGELGDLLAKNDAGSALDLGRAPTDEVQTASSVRAPLPCTAAPPAGASAAPATQTVVPAPAPVPAPATLANPETDGVARTVLAPPGTTVAGAAPLGVTGSEGQPAAAASPVASRPRSLPCEIPEGFFGGLPYFFKVVAARIAHRKAVRQLQRTLAADQDGRSELLRELGRRGRQVEVDHPEIQPAMTVVKAVEEERGAVDTAQADLDARQAAEEQELAAVEADCNQRMSVAQEDASQVQAQLDEAEARMRQLTAQLAQQERETKGLAAQQASRRTQATKTQDSGQQEMLQRAVADLGVQIGDREQQREALRGEIAQLKPLVEQRRADLAQARARIAEIRKELAAARQELGELKRQVAADKRKQRLRAAELDQQLEQRLLELGEALEQSRIAGQLDDLYSRLDQQRQASTARQAEITSLTQQADSYDRRAYRNGLIVSLAATAVVAIGIAVLVLAVAL